MKQGLFVSLLVGSLIFSAPSYALVGGGHMSPFIGQWTADEQGGHESALSFWPYISANQFMHLGGSYFFVPEAGLTFSRSSYDDEMAANGSDEQASSRQLYFILLNFSYMPFQDLHLKFGVGEFFTKVSTEGGAVERANGGQTETFYQPSESSTSYNTTLNLGIEKFVIPRFSVKAELYTWNIMSSVSRRWNFALGINYHL